MFDPLRPNDQRAKNAILLLWICLVFEIASLFSGYFHYELLVAISNGEEVSPETADASDLREGLLAIINIIVYIVSIVMFILWFRRAYFNLHKKIAYLDHSEGWAAGAWFVPILNLYRPFQIMKELYVETKAFLVKNGWRSRLIFQLLYWVGGGDCGSSVASLGGMSFV